MRRFFCFFLLVFFSLAFLCFPDEGAVTFEEKVLVPEGSLTETEIFGMTNTELINGSIVLKRKYQPLKVIECVESKVYPESKMDVGSIKKTGNWEIAGASFNAFLVSSNPGDSLEFDFYGTRLDLMSGVGPEDKDFGFSRLFIDGKEYEKISLSRPYVRTERCTAVSGLPLGVHHVKIEVISRFNVRRFCPAIESYYWTGEVVLNPIILPSNSHWGRFYADYQGTERYGETTVQFDILDLNDKVIISDVKPDTDLSSLLKIRSIKLCCRLSTAFSDKTPIIKSFGVSGVEKVENISLMMSTEEIFPEKLICWPESGMIKVFKDTAVKEDKVGSPILIKSARGEYESAQLLLHSTRPMKILDIAVTDLLSNKEKIDHTNICLRTPEYVWIHRGSPSLPGTHMARPAPDEYPDPLFNIEPFNLPSGETRSIWITLKVPRKTLPGRYKGEIHLLTNYGKVAYPIEVEIWPFEVPEERHINVFFWLCPYVNDPCFEHSKLVNDWQPSVFQKRAEAEGEKWFQQLDVLAKDLSEHHITMVRLDRINAKILKNDEGAVVGFDFSLLDKYIEVFRRNGIKNFYNGAVVKQIPDNDYEWLFPFEAEYLRALDDYIVKKGLVGRFYTSVADEPVNERTSNHAKWARKVKELAPHIITHDCSYATNYPSGGVDIISLLPSTLDRAWNHYQEVKKAGTELWFYTAWTTGKYPNCQIDKKLIQCRLLWWLNWKYQLPGYACWGLNVWLGIDPYGAPDMRSPAGDAYIIYPMKDDKIIDSIRFENYRDGIEDYEYMWLLSKLCKENNVPDKTGEICSSIVRSFTDYSQTPSEFISAREEIAKEIIKLMENGK